MEAVQLNSIMVFCLSGRHVEVKKQKTKGS